jgi:hypothetical protein
MIGPLLAYRADTETVEVAGALAKALRVVDELNHWFSNEVDGVSVIPVASVVYAYTYINIDISGFTIWDTEDAESEFWRQHDDAKDDLELTRDNCLKCWLAMLSHYGPYRKAIISMAHG